MLKDVYQNLHSLFAIDYCLVGTMFLPPPSLAVISIILGFCTQRASQLPSLFSQDVWDVFPLISGKKRIYQVILQFFDFPLFVYDILSLSFTPTPAQRKKRREFMSGMEELC